MDHARWMLMDSPAHGTACGSAKGVALCCTPSDRQAKQALLDGNLVELYFDRVDSKVSDTAVLYSVKQNYTYDSGKVKNAQRDIHNGQNDRSIRNAAVGSNVSFRERMAPIAFQIAYGILEYYSTPLTNSVLSTLCYVL